MIKRFSFTRLSFRAKTLFVSFVLQFVFVAAISASLIVIVANRGGAALRDNLAAATAAYARNASFVFISSLEENRQEILEAATASPNIDAAFLISPERAILAATDESWNKNVANDIVSAPKSETGFVIEKTDYWIFVEPVYAVDPVTCTDFRIPADECESSQELLGYYAVVGSTELIDLLFLNAAIKVFIAAIVLLALNYWATSRLARHLYRPMLDLANQTRSTADRGYREKLDYSGPVEVESIASAINHLIDQASQKADELAQKVAEKTQEERAAREDAEAARAIAVRVQLWRTELMEVNTHELLTPLRTLDHLLDSAQQELRWLERGRTRETITRRLSEMKFPIQRIAEIVEQVNIAMQIEEGSIDVRPTNDALQATLDRVVALHSAEIQRRENSLTVKCDVKNTVYIDHRMLETIVSNLVGNACKFTRNGLIELTACELNDAIKISCSDTGIGIPEEKKQ